MPQAPILYPTNHLDGAALAVTGEAAGFSRERLRDRFIGPAYKDSATGANRDISADRGAGGTYVGVDTLLIPAGHTLAGVSCQLYSSPDAVAFTLRDSFTPADATAVRRTIGALTLRAWLFRGVSTSVAMQMTELALAKAVAYPRPPLLEGMRPGRRANVVDHESVAGLAISASRGATRWQATYTVRGLNDQDKSAFEQAFDDLAGGAKPCFLLDADGILRWVQWVDREPEYVPYTVGKWQTTHRFVEVLAL